MKKIIISFSVFFYTNMIIAEAVIKNPIAGSGITSITGLLKAILNAITIIAIPILVLALIWSGFKFIKAQGDPTSLGDAKKTFGMTILGGAIILGSNIILSVITDTTDQVLTASLI